MPESRHSLFIQYLDFCAIEVRINERAVGFVCILLSLMAVSDMTVSVLLATSHTDMIVLPLHKLNRPKIPRGRRVGADPNTQSWDGGGDGRLTYLYSYYTDQTG